MLVEITICITKDIHRARSSHHICTVCLWCHPHGAWSSVCGPTGRTEPLWLWGCPNAPDPEHDRAHEPQPGTDLYLRGQRDRRGCGLSALSVHNKGNAHCFMVGAHTNEHKRHRDLGPNIYHCGVKASLVRLHPSRLPPSWYQLKRRLFRDKVEFLT